jgi:outer membrane protein W
MHIKNINNCVAGALFAGLVSVPAVQAAPAAGDREITLQGTGTSDEEFDNNIFSASGSYGWFLTDQSEWGIRQSVGVSDNENADTNWSGATRLFYDWHLDAGQWQPYLGASVGYIYGENTHETFSAGPELGVKYYVKDKTFIALSAEYQFLFDDSDDIDNNYDNGALFYGLGVGFNF